MADELNRRNFLKTAALAAGPAMLPARGANDKVNVAWIGVGTRGYASLDWMHTAEPDNVQITAICDTYQGYIARALDRMQTVWGSKPKTYLDYHELLADPNVDAVFIMTPEHLHHDMAIAALRAGKHVYVEKPLAHTIEEGFEIVKAWEDANKKARVICQVGTQNRSSSLYKKAKELIQQGMVGEVHYVRAFWYRNGLPNEPSWRYVIPAEATPQNTDWLKFLGKAQKREWDPHRYFQWRLYWDYSGGISTDLLVHQTDIVNFMLDKTVPRSCMASGGVYRWTGTGDDRDVPDTFSAIYDYSDKLQINYSCYLGNEFFGYGEEVCGNEGTIRVLNRQDLYFEHETYNSRRPGASDRAPVNVRSRQPVHLNGMADFKESDGAINHFKNFIEAIRGNETPIAPPPIGQQAAISGHMATLSYKNEKKIVWDEAANKYHFI
ncbi:MAG TPA: Gfo/Idh/MocA family oxidoreductase [Bryobacteraceae bacterium]|nr:Gfo/Idh/MocA family oxidoreductase [Bryobacteraceae bacterium]